MHCETCGAPQEEIERQHKFLLARMESSDGQRQHLEQENRRLALDLYRATARAPFVTTETEKP